MDMNRLGKTELTVSALGFGGIVVMDSRPDAATKVVEDAVAAGINYFDIAPAYGNAEEKLGSALEPFRKDVFLACKTHLRDAVGARATLEQSMEHLRTDYFDVFQLHALTDVEKDVKAAFAKGGAMEVVLEAKAAGIIRNVGFSAHTPEAALAAMDEYDFDTVMYPVNFATHLNNSFEVDVLAEARKRDMGIIALKALARRKRSNDEVRKKWAKCWYEPIDDPELAKLALGWILAQGVSVALPPGEEDLFRMALEIYPDCREPSESELARLKAFVEEGKAIL